MNPSVMREDKVVPFQRFDLRYAPQRWAFADANRAAIDARFAAKQKTKPELWNGRVLLAHEHSVADGVCRGAFFETDYASFDAWRDWEYPDATAFDCFGTAVLQGADGGILLGVMAPHTANAGQIYFPCGTPDPNDIAGGGVDLEGSAIRELEEETGLDPEELEPLPGWYAGFTGVVILHARLMRSRQSSEALRQRILDHLAPQPLPELSDIRIVRGPADLDPMMPSFVPLFLRHIWSQAP